MNISLPYRKELEKDVKVEIIGRLLEFIDINNINICNYEEKNMCSFELNDILLLEGNHSVRKKQKQSIYNLPCQYSEKDVEHIYRLHEKLYGFANSCDKTYEISTTTAILINEILKDNIKENTAIFYNPSREIDGKPLFEIEIAVFNKKICDIVSFYADLMNYILKKDIYLKIIPAYLSWSSFSAKFINLNCDKKRFGAFGYINPEILKISKDNCNNHIALIGLPFNTLCNILSEEY